MNAIANCENDTDSAHQNFPMKINPLMTEFLADQLYYHDHSQKYTFQREIQPHTWYHVTLAQDNRQQKVYYYLNGELRSTRGSQPYSDTSSATHATHIHIGYGGASHVLGPQVFV